MRREPLLPMTKYELIERMASDADISKAAAERALNSLVAAVHRTMRKSGRMVLPQIGTLRVVERKARRGRHPQTGKPIALKASRSVKLTPSSFLRAKVN